MDAQLTDMVMRIETRARQLMLRHQQMQQECAQMQQRLEKAQDTIESLNAQNQKLKEEYDHLKMAKYIDMADDDAKQMRSRISKMVRDIDRCIAMLKTDMKDD